MQKRLFWLIAVLVLVLPFAVMAQDATPEVSRLWNGDWSDGR